MGNKQKRTVGDIPGLNLQLHPNTLKWIGLICVILGTFSTAVIQLGILGLTPSLSDAAMEAIFSDPSLTGWINTAMVCSMLSYLAIPIYAKLVFEGSIRTSNSRAYFLRLAAMALLTEIPYDLTTAGVWMDMSSQSPLWALAISSFMLMLYRRHYQPGPRGSILLCLVMLLAAAWTMVLRSQNGLLIVMLVASFYIFSAKKMVSTLACGLICFLQFPAPMGMFPVYWYDGDKGKPRKYLFYILYLAQLAVFTVLSLLL